MEKSNERHVDVSQLLCGNARCRGLVETDKVYLGDATTGAAIAGFGSDTVTFTWSSIPEASDAQTLMGTGLAYLLGYRRKHKAAA